MSQEVIFKDWEVGHGGVDHRGERVITIFCHDNIASPGIFFLEGSSLDIAKGLIDWKLHSITGHGRIENDIRVCKLAIHAVKCFDKLGTMINIINIHIFMWRIHILSGIPRLLTWYFQALDPRPSAI